MNRNNRQEKCQKLPLNQCSRVDESSTVEFARPNKRYPKIVLQKYSYNRKQIHTHTHTHARAHVEVRDLNSPKTYPTYGMQRARNRGAQQKKSDARSARQRKQPQAT
jgi:hypothetical protein